MKKRTLKTFLRDYIMLFVLIAVIAVFAVLGPIIAERNFLSIQNLLNILSQNSYLVILGPSWAMAAPPASATAARSTPPWRKPW